MNEEDKEVGWEKEDWKEFGRMKREEGKKKRASNRERSTKKLENKGINFEIKNYGAHLLITDEALGKIDFWPGTGKFRIRSKDKNGRGVRVLLKEMGYE